MNAPQPALMVFSSLFPHSGAPGAGLFIRERMFRVGRELPLVVISPKPWFPGQGLLRRFRPHFRPPAPRFEVQEGIEVYFPRFLSLPGLLRRLDGISMALASYRLVKRLREQGGYNLIDAHFAYPDGYAATRLGRWLKLPVTITLRGTEVPHARQPPICKRLVKGLLEASWIFSVSRALKDHVVSLGVPADKVQVVGNGVDIDKFHPLPREACRRALGLEGKGPVLVTVGALVERKGFHRVIELLPRLLEKHPGLVYLAIGGPGPEGDWSEQLHEQVRRLGLESQVRFLGPVAPARLKEPLSAADLFVLATSNEGWANVFLEALACGLPVVTTDVGGNREVICRDELGLVVPFGDAEALAGALEQALERSWNRDAIIAYARENAWDTRVVILKAAFQRLVREAASQNSPE
jgi:glycosyltransferase involved in cell wall biosynthesis